MKNILYLILLLALPLTVSAQKIPDMGLYKIRISGSDKNITAEIKPVKTEPCIEPDRFYNWYSSSQIKQTQGGYSGTLLNGWYNEFYLNKNLKQQGTFDKGLKNGVWKDWTEDGILIQSITWNNGIKQGAFVIYDEKGNVKQKGTYKNNEINGRLFTLNNKGEVQVSKYKQGNLIPQKQSSSFWSRIHIFKKKKH